MPSRSIRYGNIVESPNASGALACTERHVGRLDPRLDPGFRRIEIQLFEAHERRPGELLRVCVQIGRELGVGRSGALTGFLGHDLEFLANAPLDDRIVTIQSKRLALAVKDLVTDVVVDESGKLLRGRRSIPRRLKASAEFIDLCLADDNASLGAAVRCDTPVVDEQCEPDEQEMQQRLPHDPPETRRPKFGLIYRHDWYRTGQANA